MPRNIISIAAAIALIAIAPVAVKTAGAQQDNRPFSFKNAPGGIGMSIGGKQAILDQKINGNTPDNLQRDMNGLLLNVTRGPGHVAIVTYNGSNAFVPAYRGTGYRGDNALMQAGIFNPYFSAGYGGSAYEGYDYSQFQTASMINAWTMALVNQNISSGYYSPSNPIDFWTGYVYGLKNQ